jgi:HK97 family phage portal protein
MAKKAKRSVARSRQSVAKDATSGQWFVDWARGGSDTLSGPIVSPETAMRYGAVFTCVRNRSEDIGKLPCLLYRRRPDGGKDRAIDHPLYSLIRERPNPFQTAFEFKQLLQAWCDLRGNGYALKQFDGRGRITALWPVNPRHVQVLRVPGTWEVFYGITIPNQPAVTLPAEAILHLRGMTVDGYCGLSPISYHRETIGLGIAAERYGAAFFGNSAQPRGALKFPGILDGKAADKLRADWENKYRGSENANRLAIFDGGMEWIQTGMNNADAQYIEARKFQNQQIFAMYRMPAHKAGDLDKATFSNIEQQALEYISDCLMTEMVRWEQTLARDLLLERERMEYFFEFLPDALLRGDLQSRYGAYATARNWGWLNVDEIRDKENMNPIPGGKGKIYLQPLNMSEAGVPQPQQLPKPAPASVPDLTPAAAKQLIRDLSMFVARSEANGEHMNGHA